MKINQVLDPAVHTLLLDSKEARSQIIKELQETEVVRLTVPWRGTARKFIDIEDHLVIYLEIEETDYDKVWLNYDEREKYLGKLKDKYDDMDMIILLRGERVVASLSKEETGVWLDLVEFSDKQAELIRIKKDRTYVVELLQGRNEDGIARHELYVGTNEDIITRVRRMDSVGCLLGYQGHLEERHELLISTFEYGKKVRCEAMWFAAKTCVKINEALDNSRSR